VYAKCRNTSTTIQVSNKRVTVFLGENSELPQQKRRLQSWSLKRLSSRKSEVSHRQIRLCGKSRSECEGNTKSKQFTPVTVLCTAQMLEHTTMSSPILIINLGRNPENSAVTRAAIQTSNEQLPSHAFTAAPLT
jgi:hypothetical protein